MYTKRIAESVAQYGTLYLAYANSKEVREFVNHIYQEMRPPLDRQIQGPADVYRFTHQLGLEKREQMWVLILNAKNYILDTHILYMGTATSSPVRIGEVFSHALRMEGVAVVIAHNHPSGVLDPSPEDVAVTRQLVQAGKLLDVEVMDHVVIAGNEWLSLRERKLGFTTL